MQPLPAAFLTRQRSQASDTMFDTCRVLARAQTGADSHNRPTYGYTPQTAVLCGIKVASNKEAEAAGKVVLVDYVVRLPHGIAVTREDRIELLTRYGAPDFQAVVCEIVGEIGHGSTAVTVNLKVVVNG